MAEWVVVCWTLSAWYVSLPSWGFMIGDIVEDWLEQYHPRCPLFAHGVLVKTVASHMAPRVACAVLVKL